MQLVGESTVAALSRDAVAEPVREFRFGFGLSGLPSPEQTFPSGPGVDRAG
jgi:hypothetical protein